MGAGFMEVKQHNILLRAAVGAHVASLGPASLSCPREVYSGGGPGRIVYGGMRCLSQQQLANVWSLRYVDFWGPVSNFGIPVAAVMDTQKSPELYVISRPLLHSSTLVSPRHRSQAFCMLTTDPTVSPAP